MPIAPRTRLAVAALVLPCLLGGGILGSAPDAASATNTAAAHTQNRNPTFTFAVFPDTQEEVEALVPDDPRFRNRTEWLVANRGRLNLQFALHVGDIVNWGWVDPHQYDVADDAMSVLDDAGIPYTIAAGNHDTRAVGWNEERQGYGGSAYVNNPECVIRFSEEECDTRLLVRHTEEFNEVFPPERMAGLQGVFEEGKSENSYSIFPAGRTDWLVLTLELWPRQEAIDWAKTVVEQHPHHNVIVNTHSYLDGAGGIVQNDGGYGATSPQHLFDELISQYENIRLVFSGHTGQAGHRVDVGVHGNPIHSFLTTFHSKVTNPVRLVRVNTRRNTLTTWIEAPYTGEVFDQYSLSLAEMDWH
jgi:hypothetical protein